MKMASLCAASARPSQLIQRFHRPTARAEIPSITTVLKLTQPPFNSRFQNAITLQVKRRLFAAFASKSNPSSGDSIQDKSDGNKSNAAQGPPFLTILAGFLVLFIIFWVFGSIIMWLFGLIVKAPPSS
ncbi:hypothetical protein P3X46_024247 [Hevea brasiliensis]|uniref:Uncharacterized protein n=2 Tax=Hevea brasiliensis TaxID=3981 RepID=A0A6A6N3B7_HEVBR|nr:uncharacterized protein LOC110669336 isoform X2 [Hevea brasiliensis]KAF2319335.1 hypothetical protein GH714_014867 [Hevea brasiliensis]KAJ9158686.1 hypothetical protein P3X46_024247 [Hevea brasiliensis]